MLLETELMEHKYILNYFKDLPVALRKLIQKFHQSRRPVLPCHACNKRYYQVCCFHKWVPWCQYHHAFPIYKEGLYYSQRQWQYPSAYSLVHTHLSTAFFRQETNLLFKKMYLIVQDKTLSGLQKKVKEHLTTGVMTTQEYTHPLIGCTTKLDCMDREYWKLHGGLMFHSDSFVQLLVKSGCSSSSQNKLVDALEKVEERLEDISSSSRHTSLVGVLEKIERRLEDISCSSSQYSLVGVLEKIEGRLEDIEHRITYYTENVS